MAMSEIVTTSKFRDALFTCILNALSSNSETRRVAEEQLKAMEVVSDYGYYLIDISLRKETILAVRQMSLSLLKHYIKNNWCHTDARETCTIDPRSKEQIRRALLHGLKECDRKIRNSVAYCIAFIACKDWPELWPDLFDTLDQNLMARNEISALGVVRVFQEISQEVDVSDMCMIVPQLIEYLCFILNNEQRFSLVLRIESVHTFILILNLFTVVKNYTKEFMISKLPILCEIFINSLQGVDETVQNCGYKANVMKFITILVHKIPQHVAPFLTSILPTIWGMVMTYGDMYIKSVIYHKEFVIEAENEEGKLMGFTPLVLSIFDFIYSLVNCSNINTILFDALPDIIYYIMIFMLMTKNMEQIWSSDAVRYVDDNSEDFFDTSVRMTARDVLMVICSDFDEEMVIRAVCHALNRHTSESTSKETNTCYWWKTHEVCLYTLGLTRDIVIPHYENSKLDFDLTSYLVHWHVLSASVPPLLAGRSIWFGAKYSKVLCAELYNCYLSMTCTFIRSDDAVLRLCAIRSLVPFCENYDENPNLHNLKHYIPTIIDELINIISGNQFNHFVVVDCLEAVNLILMVDKEFTSSMEGRIITLTTNLFTKYSHDPEIIEQIKSVFKSYCQIQNCAESVQHKLVLALTNILNTPKEKVPPGIHVVAIDILQSVMKSSKIPLNDILIDIGFPTVIKSILKSDDQLLMQSGGECLRWYLILAAEKVLNFSDGDGQTGLDYILEIINKLLDPVFSENASKRAGKLIITLMNKAGPILEPRIHMLLRSLLSKMQRAESMDIWQSILIVFAYLFYTQTEAIVNFLISIPGPTGVSAMEFVLKEWLFRESYFVSFYGHTVSTIGLCKLLEYAVTTQNMNFDNIMVRDELVEKVKHGKSETEFTLIPVLAKIFKIIVRDLVFYTELQNAPLRANPHDFDSDTTATDISDEQSENDPDHDNLFTHDQIYQVNLLTFLSDFMHKLKMIPSFNRFIILLTDKERQILASLNIST